MTVYDVAVMNYPLFDKSIPSERAAGLITSAPRHADPGGPWPTSLYIHIPFCSSLCDFCVYDRMLAPGNGEIVDAFVEALLREIHLYGELLALQSDTIGALFLGGGTPTSLSARQLERILLALRANFPLDGCEITVECHPSNATREKLAVLKQYGVTRVSTGVQSFRDAVRRRYRIAGSADKVERWLEELHGFHFEDESLDLLYGFPDQEAGELLQDVQKAIDKNMGHISLYKLAVFAYTTLYRQLKEQPASRLPDTEACYELFLQAHRLLLRNGYVLQSAQEYGKAGKSVRFWDCTYDGYGDNLSMGVSSFGYFNGYCYQNAADVGEYIRILQEGRLPIARISPRITPDLLRERAAVMGFRRGYLLSKPFADTFHCSLESVFAEPLQIALREGLVEAGDDRYSLTEKGLYYQGSVSAAFMVTIFRGVSSLKKKMCIGSHDMP